MIILVNGFVSDDKNVVETTIACKFIKGKTEVLTFKSGNVSIGVEFNKVEELIEKVRGLENRMAGEQE